MKANKFLVTSFTVGILASNTTFASDVKVSTGFLYVNGQNTDLSLADVKLSSIPLSLKVQNDAFGFKISTSYLNLDAGTGTTEKGIGDTRLTLSYDVSPQWTLSIQEKFSTGDDKKGLSTGFNDTKVAVDYSKPLSGGKSVFGSLAYKVKGGKGSNPNYKNAADISLGMSKIISDNVVIGGSINYAQSSTSTLNDTTGGLAFVSRKLNKNWRTNAFVGYDNSKTKSAGVSISYKF